MASIAKLSAGFEVLLYSRLKRTGNAVETFHVNPNKNKNPTKSNLEGNPYFANAHEQLEYSV